MKFSVAVFVALIIAGCQPSNAQPPAKQAQPAATPIPETASKSSGPFGLEMGTPLAELSKQMELKPVAGAPGLYNTPTVPKPHPDFLAYTLVITPGQGLCKIASLTGRIRTSVYGTELVSKFNSLEEALTTKYGKSKRFDSLRRGSIWKDSKDWMMALNKKERTLISFWPVKDSDKLPYNLSVIMLDASAYGTEEGVISIIYEFGNEDQCLDWIKSQKNSAL